VVVCALMSNSLLMKKRWPKQNGAHHLTCVEQIGDGRRCPVSGETEGFMPPLAQTLWV
jgi:hypothetical protein